MPIGHDPRLTDCKRLHNHLRGKGLTAPRRAASIPRLGYRGRYLSARAGIAQVSCRLVPVLVRSIRRT